MAVVLLVDDEPDLRDVVRLNLELEGHEVVTASDGLEALRLVAGGFRPDIVVLDVMMPGLDGWETLSRLKSDPSGSCRDMPVLLLTARADDMDRIRGGIEGAVRYLTKPFGMDVLVAAVEDALAADEPTLRKQVQRASLGQLARLEKGEEIDHDAGVARNVHEASRVRFNRLEHAPVATATLAEPTVDEGLDLSSLSVKQIELLRAVGGHGTVSDAATSLGVSRSNVYASLRRIARKLDIAAVPELVLRARRVLG